MRPASARHLVVLGVCALGVVGLYVAPSLARSSGSVPPGDRERGEPASMSAHSAPGEGTVHGRLNAPMATAHDPALLPDTTPPSSVQGISFPEILPDRLTIRWAPASDDVGIAAYRIWLDGFQLADTTALQVTLAWFRDGSRQQVVQIRAVDAAGNLSEQAPPVLVARPTGTPTSPSGAGEPVATGSPSATADPTSATATIASPLDGDG